jgi:hypothetical protein
MELFQNRYRVKSVRLKGYDYNQRCLFKSLSLRTITHVCFAISSDAQIVLKPFGEMAKTEWKRTTDIGLTTKNSCGS